MQTIIMRKILRKAMGGIFHLVFLSVCLSANYPPHIVELENQLESSNGIEKIKLLTKIGNEISPYDFNKGQKYFDESNELTTSNKELSKFEKLKHIRRNETFRSYGYLYSYNHLEAFRGSLKIDSLALLFTDAPDSLKKERWLSNISANTLRNAVFMDQKMFHQAQRELESAIESCNQLSGKDRDKLGSVYSNLGINLMLQDKFEESEKVMLKADSIYSAAESERNIAYCKMFQVDLYIRSNQWEKGFELIDDALRLVKKHIPSREPLMTAQAARIYYENDLVEASDSLIAAGAKVLEQVKEPGASIWFKNEVSNLYKRQNKFEEALKYQMASQEENKGTDAKIYSKELLILQEKYTQNKYSSNTKSEALPFWIFLGLVILVGFALKFLYKEKVPRIVIEEISSENQKLEIAWKHENNGNKVVDPFVERFVLHVQDNIDRGDVSVDKIADEMRISRVQLFRKVKAATGESPSVLIRQIRLKTAERLLVENVGNISEVAYKVGFSNPNSFSRAFKNHFGSSPKEYLLRQHG